MEFKITVEKLAPRKEGERYPDATKVFEQILEDVDVPSLVIYINEARNPLGQVTP